MNRVLVVFSDGLLSELDSARGLVSRSAWIRQAVEDKLMKEAVAPLVPWTESDIVFDSEPETVDLMVAVRDEIDRRKAITPNEFDAHKAKPKARRKKSVKVPDQPVSVMNRGGENCATQEPSRPTHCNRGACPGTIHPRTGSCNRCMQKPLKESK